MHLSQISEGRMISHIQALYAAEWFSMRTFARTEFAADSDALRRTSSDISRQSVQHRECLTEVFDHLGRPALMGHAPAIETASTQCVEIATSGPKSPARDAAIITAMRILLQLLAAHYGSAEIWADRSGQSDAAAMLHDSLSQTIRSDHQLSVLAVSRPPDQSLFIWPMPSNI